MYLIHITVVTCLSVLVYLVYIVLEYYSCVYDYKYLHIARLNENFMSETVITHSHPHTHTDTHTHTHTQTYTHTHTHTHTHPRKKGQYPLFLVNNLYITT